MVLVMGDCPRADTKEIVLNIDVQVIDWDHITSYAALGASCDMNTIRSDFVHRRDDCCLETPEGASKDGGSTSAPSSSCPAPLKGCASARLRLVCTPCFPPSTA